MAKKSNSAPNTGRFWKKKSTNLDRFNADTSNAQVGDSIWCFRRGERVTVTSNVGWPMGGEGRPGQIVNGLLLVSLIVDRPADTAKRFKLARSTVQFYRAALHDLEQQATSKLLSKAIAGQYRSPPRSSAHDLRPATLARYRKFRADQKRGLKIPEIAERHGVCRNTVIEGIKVVREAETKRMRRS